MTETRELHNSTLAYVSVTHIHRSTVLYGYFMLLFSSKSNRILLKITSTHVECRRLWLLWLLWT